MNFFLLVDALKHIMSFLPSPCTRKKKAHHVTKIEYYYFLTQKYLATSSPNLDPKIKYNKNNNSWFTII
jgi:hypothetical protein